jgi:hypothetical protein
MIVFLVHSFNSQLTTKKLDAEHLGVKYGNEIKQEENEVYYDSFTYEGCVQLQYLMHFINTFI